MALTRENHTGRDVEVAPELAGLELADKPDGPAAAVMVATGVGIFVLGLLTTLSEASAGIHGFLADFQGSRGVGPLAGKTIIAVLAWGLSWLLLHRAWRNEDKDLRKMFNLGFALGILGALGTFPPFFVLFK